MGNHKCAYLMCAAVFVLAAGFYFGAAFAVEDVAKTTIENLQAAFNGESNANARYMAFAEKADLEGFHQVASLFRAAATAEKVHFEHHAIVIKAMGAVPKADIAKAEAKSTKEDLEAAIRGESCERDTMYPAFIKVAEADKNQDAVRTFKRALSAETEHAKLYKQALDNMDTWKDGTKTFLVCSNCGFTAPLSDLKQCPVCAYPRSKIIEVK